MEAQYLYTEKKRQQFREADADGLIGMKGYMDYFQDAAAGYMYHFGWGNDMVHERYGVAWVYVKYRMQVYERTAYEAPLDLECWIEPAGHSVSVKHALEIRKEGRLLANGRLESCLVDLKKRRITRLDAIEFDPVITIPRENPTPDFSRIEQDTEGCEYIYSHRVRYSDLDNNGHMNNLRYIPLLLDCYSPEHHEKKKLRDLEIHYRNQCLYDEEVRLFCIAEEENTDRLVILKEDGTAAACARFIWTEEMR